MAGWSDELRVFFAHRCSWLYTAVRNFGFESEHSSQVACGRRPIMRTRLALVVVATVIATAIARSQSVDLEMTDRVVVASRIYALVQQFFAHWDGASRGSVEESYRVYVDHVV